jgi:hypothetical protein
MSKKTRRKGKGAQKQASSRLLPALVIAAGGVLLLAAVGLVLARPGSGGDAQADRKVAGAPRLTVDQAVIDEGYIKYDVPIQTAFRLSNAGDEPLKIVDAPQVRLVDGC